jgi:DNA-binding IclR family transcriptional regulator
LKAASPDETATRVAAAEADPPEALDIDASASSSLHRMMAVLELFSDHRLNWSVEAIADALQVSLPTSYRYVKVLVEAGLLQRAGAGAAYSLGPRIIVLDHYIRMTDPVLRHAIPYMEELVETSGFDCVISALYGPPQSLQLLDTHRVYGKTPASLSYGRGRPRPLFLGGAPKIILASLAPAQLHKVFDSAPADIAAAGLPQQWPLFRKYFAAIRKAGFYLSVGELEPNLAAMAAPLQKADGTVLGAISLVTTLPRMGLVDTAKLADRLRRAAQDSSSRVE